MNNNDILIRTEERRDYRAAEHLVRECFWNVYRPGCCEHFVLHLLRDHPDFVPELDFVMEKNGEIIGQNVFVKTHITLDDGSAYPIMTMGPICIAEKEQRKGYGKLLLDYSLEKAKAFGCKALCFEGNIQFYGKSGFVVASSKGIRYEGMPEGVEADFFLCKELEEGYFNGIHGVYAPPKCYFAADDYPDAFEQFDAEFPRKVKLKLPGQLP
ncbi:MAG: N-acetyltransferase [Oscillospiraceae bacterium]|nr:N-acetyltransferase [Oscillospiraceae bacterium]